MADSMPVPAIENFVWCRGFPRHLQNFAALVIGEHDGLAGRAQNHESSGWSFRVALNIVLDLLKYTLPSG